MTGISPYVYSRSKFGVDSGARSSPWLSTPFTTSAASVGGDHGQAHVWFGITLCSLRASTLLHLLCILVFMIVLSIRGLRKRRMI